MLNCAEIDTRFFCFLGLLFLKCTAGSDVQYLTIYNDIYFTGVQKNVNFSTCSKVPFARIASIKIYGQCARLYNDDYCEGRFMEVLPNSPLLHVTIAWDNYMDAISAGPCLKPCSKEITRFSPQDSVMVHIYEDAYYKGVNFSIMVTNCTKLPNYFVHQTKSIKTYDHCIKLYNNEYCRSDGEQYNSIALGEGTPLHSDLHDYWQFKTAKSISNCNFGCSRQGREIQLPRQGELVFYERPDFNGRLFVMTNINKSCKDIPAVVVNSIQITRNTCAFLFGQSGCSGVKYVLNMSVSNLTKWKPNLSIKSITECLQTETTYAVVFETTMKTIWETSSVPEINTTNSQDVKHNSKYEGVLESDLSLIMTIALVSIVGLLSCIFITVFLKRKCHAYRRETGGISEREFDKFFNGDDVDSTPSRSNSTEKVDERSTEALAQNRPYNKKYDVSCSRIEYDMERPMVKKDDKVFYKGTLKPLTQEPKTSVESSGKIVTIITANPSSGVHGFRSILKEVKVMLYLGKHANIAHLVGCCTENLKQGRIFVLMEFCGGGTLYSYIQNNRQSFTNLVTKGRLSIDCDIGLRVKSIQLPNMTGTTREQFSFDIFLIVQWCIDVSSGMEFLSNAKIVHSDLAAKNVLLTDNLQAKISDYGLSRQMYSCTRYLKTQHEPWRWMAPESIKRLEFSIKSDVWSYGVLCWEMFTLGEKPYHGIRLKEQFMYNIEEGLRLTKPRNATNEFYTLMLRCWEDEPEERPSFAEISDQIQEMLQALINWMN